MNYLRRVFVVALAAAAFVSSGVIAAEASVTGEWALAVDTGQGTGTPTMTLKQEGANITGTYKSQMFGDAPITGTLKGGELVLNIKASAQGQDVVIVYTGTVTGGEMKGKVNLGGMAEGTFTGKKAG